MDGAIQSSAKRLAARQVGWATEGCPADRAGKEKEDVPARRTWRRLDGSVTRGGLGMRPRSLPEEYAPDEEGRTGGRARGRREERTDDEEHRRIAQIIT